MLESLQFTGTQVLVLFLLMGVGFLCARKKLLTDGAVKSLTDLMLYIITPCMMISAFQQVYDPRLLRGFLITAAVCAAVYAAEIGLAHLLIREPDQARRRVLRFGAVFPNCGYMALPLLQALFGSEAVLYGAAFNAVNTIYLWTYGLTLMANGKEKIRARTLLLNPNMISIAVGLLLFFGSVRLPTLLGKPIEYIAAMNAPVPMLLIGFYLARLDLRTVLRSRGELLLLALRLLLVPLLTLGVLYLCGVRGTLLTTNVLCVSAPVATMCTMLSTKYDADPVLAAGCVAVSTLLSVVTMTVLVGFTGYIA